LVIFSRLKLKKSHFLIKIGRLFINSKIKSNFNADFCEI